VKTMTCSQLGGACDARFQGETFDELAAQSKAHGGAMFKAQDPDHLAAMEKMMAMMSEPGAMAAWMDAKRLAFEALPEDA